MSGSQKYLVSALIAVGFGAVMPLLFGLFRFNSDNFAPGFKRYGEGLHLSAFDGVAHIFDAMPSLWLLVLIPAVIGLMAGLTITSDQSLSPGNYQSSH